MISNQTCDVEQSVQNQVVEIVCESRKNTSPFMYPFALPLFALCTEFKIRWWG
jgi:hypothetical protein